MLLLLAWVLCSRLSHPWTYNDDYNGAFWSQAARNLNQAGFLATAGVPAPLYYGQPPIPADALYVHHPTLLAAMMAADRALLGESEWAARLLPVGFSLLTAVLLWLFASFCLGWRAGALSLAFFLAAPMELHYGQMVNFEAPELFFLLAALCCFHLWRCRRTSLSAAGLVLCCCLAMWTDWQGYLLVILLASQLILKGPGRNARLAAALLMAACLCGIAFLLQIHRANPAAWQQLLDAFHERAAGRDVSGGAFTAGQWLATEGGYLITLFSPFAWLLAAAGAVIAFIERRRLTPREAAPIHIGSVLFVIDAFYVCLLRNQSYIHDFAAFYFLIPVAVFSAFFVDWIIRKVEAGRPGFAPAASLAACVIAGLLIWWGIRSLDGIDTQFCILDDDSTEPATLMPDVGRLIDRTFAPDAVILCNFDPYYSPLPFYARHVMSNGNRTYADWQSAITDALPDPAGGIVWTGDPESPVLLSHLPPLQLRLVRVDGIPFILWTPPDASRHGP